MEERKTFRFGTETDIDLNPRSEEGKGHWGGKGPQDAMNNPETLERQGTIVPAKIKMFALAVGAA